MRIASAEVAAIKLPTSAHPLPTLSSPLATKAPANQQHPTSTPLSDADPGTRTILRKTKAGMAAWMLRDGVTG